MASGSWILGVSLGAERIMRMEGSEGMFDVLLPSGSVYLQK
jgi:alkylated DNA repair protein alkB family protein 7